MPNPKAELRVSVVETMKSSSHGLESLYSKPYYKPEKSPQLLAKRLPDHDDLGFPMTAAEFLAGAWRLANGMARELGWIA